jgi:hypothetical protein
MTQETYRVEREGVDQDEKKDEDKKKKTMAVKARKKNQVKKRKVVTLTMKLWLSLCARWVSS